MDGEIQNRKESDDMSMNMNAAGSVMNSTTAQQTQQQTERVQTQRQLETDQARDMTLPAESTVNELDLSVAYEVKLTDQANAAYTQPQTTETQSDAGGGSAAAETASAQSAPVATTQSTGGGTAVEVETTSSDSSSNLTPLTEQQMRTMVSDGTITRSQMLDELARRNGEA